MLCKVRSSEFAGKACVFEVYSGYESDANGLYTVTIGISDNNEPIIIPECACVTISTGNYHTFQGTGSMPSTVVETRKQIWSYFETESNYQRNFVSDLEEYSGSDKVCIYIGIK